MYNAYQVDIFGIKASLERSFTTIGGKYHRGSWVFCVSGILAKFYLGALVFMTLLITAETDFSQIIFQRHSFLL